jgi:hypothetical protein
LSVQPAASASKAAGTIAFEIHRIGGFPCR